MLLLRALANRTELVYTCETKRRKPSQPSLSEAEMGEEEQKKPWRSKKKRGEAPLFQQHAGSIYVRCPLYKDIPEDRRNGGEIGLAISCDCGAEIALPKNYLKRPAGTAYFCPDCYALLTRKREYSKPPYIGLHNQSAVRDAARSLVRDRTTRN